MLKPKHRNVHFWTRFAMEQWVSCEEFERMCIAEELGHCELIDGEIVQLPFCGPEQSFVSCKFSCIVSSFVARKKLGRVFSNETGIHTRFDPPRSRGMDVAYFSYKRLPRGKLPKSFFRTGPELIVEVLGEDSSWPEMNTKIAEYHAIGTDMVWIADPEARTVTKFPRGGVPELVPAEGKLDGGEILPGFKVRVAKFFETE